MPATTGQRPPTIDSREVRDNSTLLFIMASHLAETTSAAFASALGGLRAGRHAPLAAWLREHLFSHVMAFWEGQVSDSDGGISTCIAADGTVVSTDKWMWSQWRAVWIFSRLARRLGADPVWLQRARRIIAFCSRKGWDEHAGGWALVLDSRGEIVRGHESIYSDAFAVSALVEYHLATGDADALSNAIRTADAALRILAGPVGRIPHFPYPIPAGAKPHGIPMIWSLVLGELGSVTGEKRYQQAAAALAEEIFRDFHRPEFDLVVEFVACDGTRLATAEGRTVVPGHVIEGMWFNAHLAKLPGQTGQHVSEAFRLILRHLDIGWDRSNGGGLLLAVDAENRPDVAWRFADSKLWWPQTEALYATLLGWSATGQPAFIDWYERLWRTCLDHFVDWQNGEWRQKLTRTFQPFAETVALPVKDPFHLPRSLMLQIELLEDHPKPASERTAGRSP